MECNCVKSSVPCLVPTAQAWTAETRFPLSAAISGGRRRRLQRVVGPLVSVSRPGTDNLGP